MSCVFCDIVGGRADASVVYDDEATLAFANLRQPTWPRGGDVLVVPKQHVELLYNLPPELAGDLMRTVVRIGEAMHEALEPEGISVWSSNGPAAGQEVPHVHVHVLARFTGDELMRIYPAKPAYPERTGLDQLAARVKAGLGGS
jgi:histidine triad (HIT) family protein